MFKKKKRLLVVKAEEDTLYALLSNSAPKREAGSKLSGLKANTDSVS